MHTVTIPNGGVNSDPIALHGASLSALAMPAAWTAADIVIQGSLDGAAWLDAYDAAGNKLTVKVDHDRFVVLSPDATIGLQWVRFVSTVAQGGARVIGYEAVSD